jgi:nucleotide-binding universal stress UspA family protein
MYQTIVVGTDGSDTASAAVDAAIGLARGLGAHLHVVCADNSAQVSSSMAAAAGVAVSWGELEEAARENTSSVLSAARSRASSQGVETTLHPCTGAASESLVTVAIGERADLIVVGNRGMKGARRLLGSVPNHVAHHAPCAVMIVPTS